MKVTLEDKSKLRMTFWISDFDFSEGNDIVVGEKTYEKTEEKHKMKGEEATVVYKEKAD